MHTYFITQQILSDKVITPQTQMCIYHALINALRAHMIHISLNIFYTHVEHSPTETIYMATQAVVTRLRGGLLWLSRASALALCRRLP